MGRWTWCGIVVLALPGAAAPSAAQEAWAVHDPDRPPPPVVAPAQSPGAPPDDAVVLFGGQDLSAWETARGTPAGWRVDDGVVEVVPGTGSIRTRRSFGDVQLHIEWMAPVPADGDGQDRGNSGVFLMGRYEIQVLDSWRNRTYADGQAAAVYGQYPPLVNASRPPGEWQSYDIVFRRPRFGPDGKLESPARVTVLHNGILVHDHVALTGPTGHRSRPPYERHADRLPLGLQDHGQKVRFRNVWVRDLEGTVDSR